MTRETLEALKREHMGDGVCLSMSQVGQLLRIAEAAINLMEQGEIQAMMEDTSIYDRLAVAIGGDDDKR